MSGVLQLAALPMVHGGWKGGACVCHDTGNVCMVGLGGVGCDGEGNGAPASGGVGVAMCVQEGCTGCNG